MDSKKIIEALSLSQDVGWDKMELIKTYPEPVIRFLRYHLPQGIPTSGCRAVPMKGIIKLVNWSQFRSLLYSNPFRGFFWQATVRMGILPIKGFDYFLDDAGAMSWNLFKIIPVMNAENPDVSRSAEGRSKMEAVFSLHFLINPKVTWKVISDTEISASWKIDNETHPLHFIIDDKGALKSAQIKRWGNPGDTKKWNYHTFGVQIEKEGLYNGVMIPLKGNAGWWFGTDKYDDGEFFRFNVS